MTSDEDDWYVNAIRCDDFLQLESIQIRKRNVQYEAAWFWDPWMSKEFLGGRKCFRMPACESRSEVPAIHAQRYRRQPRTRPPCPAA
jgi:hypothetical protein